MRISFDEPCSFEAEVVSVRGGPENCRCGHEVGDRYSFAYATPEGLCGEFYHHIYPVLHALRNEAPATNFRPYSSPDEVLLYCPSRVVELRIKVIKPAAVWPGAGGEARVGGSGLSNSSA
ncbi:MAG: TIGR04076 family protein [Bacillota bacterium]|jgi:uncharacterized repeat protein (TIGR04076 family)|nr:MAG: TIGR04076 family protein [Bacillota bacterium]